MVGLPICHGAVTRNAVPHQIQIHLREMGLHQLQCVLHGIPGSSLDEGLQSARGHLQPLRKALGCRHTLGLERPKQSLQRPAQAIQCCPPLRRLIIHFCKRSTRLGQPRLPKQHTPNDCMISES